jgi:flagellar biosynthesis protein FliR
MHAKLTLSASMLLGFVLVLSRMAGVFVFVPMPVKEAGPVVARIVFALASALALFPRWPAVNADGATLATLTGWLILEAALGMAIGLMVSFITEWLTLGAQVLGLQAGYGYASVVDPTTQADSDVLPVVAQLTSGLLFFTTGLHRYVIRAFADSLDRYPPGQFAMTRDLAQTIIRLGSGVFSTGLRLALPVIGLLLMVEIALALLGRISSQLHIGMQAFPAKMLLTLATLVSVLLVVPVLYQSFASQVFDSIRRNFGH